MTNIYELSEELGVSSKALQKWLRAHGFGSGKTISLRATNKAKAHFKPSDDHPMSSALEERDGLGEIKRHEELVHQDSGIKVEARPHLKWSKVERDVDVLQMDMNTQKDFFKKLRSSGPSATSPPQSAPKLKSSAPEMTPPATPKEKLSPPSSQPLKAVSKIQAGHSIFGSLASMTPHLDSVTNRTPLANMNDEQVINLMSQDTTPLKNTNSSKSLKKSKKKKSKKANAHNQRGMQSNPETDKLASKQPTFKELFEKPEVQSLASKIDDLKTDLKALSKENESLKTIIQTLKQTETLRILDEASADSSPSTVEAHKTLSEEPTLLWSHFESFGLNVQQARFALLELLDHPQRGPELMYSLKHDQPQTLTRGFAIVCEEDVCRQVADTFARQGLIEFREKHLCSICQGSSARGWYRRLHLTATHTQRTKLLVVGGDDHVHQQLKQLNRDYGGLEWEFITGKTRLDQRAANAKTSHKSAVILWGGTHLPHALSDTFKTAAERAEVPFSVLSPGQRNVSRVCYNILKSWGVPFYEAFED